MDLKTAKGLSFDNLRTAYREYLLSQGLGINTVRTACSDTFYLWRKIGADEFWAAVTSVEFETDARMALLKALKKNTTGNPVSLVNSYMSQLRRFREFLSVSDEKTEPEINTHPPHNKNRKVQVPDPSPNQVKLYLQTWDQLENYHLQENALDKLFFSLCPHNSDMSDILLKVATLNDFYSTNIFSVYSVAKHILSLDIDPRLKAGDVKLVADMQKVEINGVVKNFYSFATKYCSHHNPLDYPIYDSYVDKMLCFFRDRDRFAAFRTEDLKDYVKFKSALTAFRNFYSLGEYNLKEIDKYIWLLGKKYFPKNYGKGKQ